MGYRLPINRSWINKPIVLRDFPNLDMVYVSAENNLCRSYYDPNVKCVTLGYLEVTIIINGEIITFRSDSDEIYHIGDCAFQATGPIVINQDPNKTYIGIDIRPLDIRNIKLGDSFTISRTSNAGTGYQWIVTPSDGLKLISAGVQIQSGIPGSPAEQVWTFEASQIGQQFIDLVYKRSWTKSPEDISERIYINVA